MNDGKKKTPHPTKPWKATGEASARNSKEGADTVSHNNRTWQTNAAEFAALDRGEGWQFAVLVACSVEKVQRGKSAIADFKVSASEFATAAKTSDTRVSRYFDAWQEAAQRGWVADASTLTPADAHSIEIPDHPWRAKDGGVYDASKTGGQINNTQQIAEKAAKDPQYAARLLGEVSKVVAEDVKREAYVSLASDDAIANDTKTRMAAHRANEEAYKPTDFAKKARQAEKAHEIEASKRTGLAPWFEASGLLGEALKSQKESEKALTAAIEFLSTRNFRGEMQEELEQGLADVKSRLDVNVAKADALMTLFREGSTDWDAALADLLGGGR